MQGTHGIMVFHTIFYTTTINKTEKIAVEIQNLKCCLTSCERIPTIAVEQS